MRSNQNVLLGAIALVVVAVGAFVIFDRADKGPLEKAGKEIDEAIDSVGNKIN